MRNAKKTSILTALGALTVLLAGCSGGGTDGVYYGEYEGSVQSVIRNGTVVRLTLDDDNVKFERPTCDGVSEGRTSLGVLNENRDTVSWTVKGNYYGTDPFTASSDGDVVTLDKTTYTKEGSDSAKALVDKFEEDCSE